MKRVIHWFRRDLRITDNTALSEAARRAEQVIPVFILEDAFRTGPDMGAARLAFLLQSLESLREKLAELGHRLIVRRGKSPEVLPRLCAELGAEAVFANKRYEPYAEARDQRVFNALNSAGVGFELVKDAVVWEEQEILTQAAKPFTVYTPYSKAWKLKAIPAPRGKLRKPSSTQLPASSIQSEPLPTDAGELGHVLKQASTAAGERAAVERLGKFMRGPVYEYGANRNLPAVDGTSLLSPHLRCGTIGIRTILAALNKAREAANTPAQRQSCEVYLNELIWREFYLQVLHNFPHVTKGAFRPEYNQLKWSDNQNYFDAWCAGMTGYPIVDAAMRCLNATGNMHNRLRMIVAMFLTKDLLINWQWGERYFMQQLVDGDLAANNGGWQWSAGTGTDAAPYFRIFNPVSQGEKFDSQGEFVRRWVAELASLPDAVVHRPWEQPLSLGGTSYPPRIVRHEEQRPKCLAMFGAVKKIVRP
ncbi:MAG: deoxyribodipyrimidine photo-lyase [Verrucomicrobia bacterium]|nr:deoxyribodipyrimidine photo-lyase [Verrucomicrobiota bacterium]